MLTDALLVTQQTWYTTITTSVLTPAPAPSQWMCDAHCTLHTEHSMFIKTKSSPTFYPIVESIKKCDVSYVIICDASISFWFNIFNVAMWLIQNRTDFGIHHLCRKRRSEDEKGRERKREKKKKWNKVRSGVW